MSLRRRHEHNQLFEQTEAEHERQEHIRKSYRDSLKDLKEFYELCLKCHQLASPESFEAVDAEVRVRQKVLYLTLREFKHTNSESKTALRRIFNHNPNTSRLVFHETANQREEDSLPLEEDSVVYEELEKKRLTLHEYRLFARVCRESPISLSAYIQHNYLGWHSCLPQIDVLTKLVTCCSLLSNSLERCLWSCEVRWLKR